jgi:hypothetical protein
MKCSFSICTIIWWGKLRTVCPIWSGGWHREMRRLIVFSCDTFEVSEFVAPSAYCLHWLSFSGEIRGQGAPFCRSDVFTGKLLLSQEHNLEKWLYRNSEADVTAIGLILGGHSRRLLQKSQYLSSMTTFSYDSTT